MLIIRLPFITVRAFGAGIAAVFGQQPSITAELGFPWNADLLALGLFWVAAVYAYFVDPHPSRRRTVTVSLLFGAMALDVLYGRYLQAWLDAAETAQYAENALGLHVDLLSVLFVLLNAAALALPLCSAFRSRKAAKKAVAAGRRTSYSVKNARVRIGVRRRSDNRRKKPPHAHFGGYVHSPPAARRYKPQQWRKRPHRPQRPA